MPRRTKDQTQAKINQAKASGKYMVAVWHIEDGKLNLYRVTNQFPLADIPEAIRLLQDDLKPITISK